MTVFPKTRMRRMREKAFSRRLMRETRLSTDDLIYPLFIYDESNPRQPVPSMPGVDRINLEELKKEADLIAALNIPAIALFPVIPENLKSDSAKEAYNPEGLVQKAVSEAVIPCHLQSSLRQSWTRWTDQ